MEKITTTTNLGGGRKVRRKSLRKTKDFLGELLVGLVIPSFAESPF